MDVSNLPFTYNSTYNNFSFLKLDILRRRSLLTLLCSGFLQNCSIYIHNHLFEARVVLIFRTFSTYL